VASPGPPPFLFGPVFVAALVNILTSIGP